jgi:hypothetical protein
MSIAGNNSLGSCIDNSSSSAPTGTNDVKN